MFLGKQTSCIIIEGNFKLPTSVYGTSFTVDLFLSTINKLPVTCECPNLQRYMKIPCIVILGTDEFFSPWTDIVTI